MTGAVADPIEAVKAAMVDTWAPGGQPVGDLKKVLDYEPTEAPDLPLLTMQTRGFKRAKLERAEVVNPIQDPLGGRRWVWLFWVRVWVAIRSDPQAAQRTLDRLIPQVVRTFEANRSLNGVAVDAAIESGDAIVVTPKTGNSTFMLTCDCAVETEEPLT